MSASDKTPTKSHTYNRMDRTPPNYVAQRNKRGRESDCAHDFNTFRNEIKIMISDLMTAQQEEIKKIHPTLMEIKATNSDIQNSVAFLTSQNEELKKKIELLETQNKKDKDYITLLEEKVEELQRENRKASIEIKNVPKIHNESKEDLIKLFLTLCNNIGCDIEKKDIRDIYRVHRKNDTNKTHLITEISSTMLKTEFLKQAKNYNIKYKEKLCAKHLGITKNEYEPIYVSEQLTAKGARLYFLARDLAKSQDYKFCWTSYGKICVRKNENSPIIVIKNESHVNSLLQKS
ncbi:uncharacterized protein [Epargyreus clarus]|uniref:uncharacterized protein n=1 Tax=Epargyreus clarus TaxID=520877 RepID=UPI003C2C6C93